MGSQRRGHPLRHLTQLSLIRPKNIDTPVTYLLRSPLAFLHSCTHFRTKLHVRVVLGGPAQNSNPKACRQSLENPSCGSTRLSQALRKIRDQVIQAKSQPSPGQEMGERIWRCASKQRSRAHSVGQPTHQALTAPSSCGACRRTVLTKVARR